MANALAPIAAEQFALAVAKTVAPPPAPVPIASRSFRQRAEEILEQGRPRPPAVEDVDDSAPAMLRDVNEHIESVLALAHSRSQSSQELYTELAPQLPELIAEKMRLERSITNQPTEPGDHDG